ncbi:MAG: hypothetical protein RL208_614 [Pseudomonadota bacterium]|jgi:rRNA-processing protein FCF1
MKQKIMLDSNLFINNNTFDQLKECINNIKDKYHLILTPYQVYKEVKAGKEKDQRTEEKMNFCKQYFEITYDINIFPTFFGIKFCTNEQLNIYRQLLYRTLNGTIEKNQEVINNYLNNYVKDEKYDRKQRDVRIGSIAFFENSTLITNDKSFQKRLSDLNIKNQSFDEFWIHLFQ